MKIAITGGTGFLGSAITAEAQAHGHDILLLTRRPGSAPRPAGVEALYWSEDTQTTLPPHDAVIHLAGESIAGFWTDAKKEEILNSRRQGTRRLVNALGSLSAGQGRPHILVSASAVGYYGERGEEVLTELSLPGSGFLADVCKTWEEEAMRAEKLGIRVVCVRIGVVLDEGGGAMERFLPPFKLGVGGPLGNGRQWFPWVHRDDVAGLFIHALENDNIHGPVNAVAPGIVRGTEFARCLGQALHRPALFPVPVFALRLLLGEFAPHLVESQRVVPKVAMDSGYQFRHPNLGAALHDILS